jgi:hypothetical protein
MPNDPFASAGSTDTDVDPFSAPSAGGGSKITDHEGCLLLITPRSHEQGIQTSFGEKDAVKADLVVLDGPNANTVETDVLIFQAQLISQTKGRINKGMVLGRLGKVPATKAGFSPSWALSDPTEDDKVTARRYLASA